MVNYWLNRDDGTLTIDAMILIFFCVDVIGPVCESKCGEESNPYEWYGCIIKA